MRFAFLPRPLVAFVVVASFLGCSPEYEVRIAVEPRSLVESAALAEIAVVSSCVAQSADGEITGSPLIRFDPSGPAQPLGLVPEGPAGVFARLVTDDCQVIASGCSPVTFIDGGDDLIRVRVRESRGDACRPGATCLGGGVCSGTVDANVADTLSDAGADVPDGSNGTGCGVCESADPCIQARCDGDRCVMEPLTDVACPGGMCHAGACCTGCWDGTACQESTSATCGTGGGACAACECPTPSCIEGACVPQPPFRQVAMGRIHACYILHTGALYCAGSNSEGQLGTGSTGAPALSPMRVGTLEDWESVCVSHRHSCAINTGGELYCWGDNGSGQAGLGGLNRTPTPTRVGEGLFDEVQCAPKNPRTIARMMDGSWVAFGENNLDQSNLGSMVTPVLVPTRVQEPPGRTWDAISMGTDHSCAIDDMGALWCWGSNDLGQAGAPQSETEPMHMVFAGPVVSVAVGNAHSCAVAENGRVYCFGGNSWRVLGRESNDPSPIPTLTDPFPSPQMRLVRGYENGCAFGADDSAVCWGRNQHGELGFENTMFFGGLVRAPHLDGAPLVLAQKASYAYLDGANQVWGENDMSSLEGHGRLGLGHLDNIFDPTPLCIPEY